MANQLPKLHAQLMARVPEFRQRWLTELGTLDHLIEHARGGGHDITNLVLACSPCNEQRGRNFEELLESEADLWVESADAASEVPVIVSPVRVGSRTSHLPMRGR